jgi:4-coumarate--CoA ligase
MTEFQSPSGPLPHIPDNLTIPQFFLDSQHSARPIRKGGIPWLIEDESGREIGFEEVSIHYFDYRMTL